MKPDPLPRPRWRRRLAWLSVSLAGLAAAAAFSLFLLLRASLPRLEGRAPLPGLGADAVVARDAEGHVTIDAADRRDAARALGYVHAQERFFQMDLLRRSADGSLAEVFGPAALDHDRTTRPFLGRRHAVAALALLPRGEREVVEAYAAGANAGLDALGARPPEYLFLRQRPAPWRPEDTLLLNLAFAMSLQDPRGNIDRERDVLARVLGPAAAAFYDPAGADSDAALDGHRFPEPPVPTPAQFRAPDNPAAPKAVAAAATLDDDQARPGSNAWAVSGRRTKSGAALVADDMHLELQVPHVWFRAVIRWKDPGGRQRQLAGVTVPGAPTLVAGSNGDVAWGFSNAAVDTSDLVDLEVSPDAPGKYRVPGGWRAFDVIEEPLRVAGSTNEILRVTNTAWGPVVGPPGPRGPRAIAWIMARPEALAPTFLAVEDAKDVASVLDAAARTARPVQNFVAGDHAGNIGWTLGGTLPDRFGTDGRVPVSWADGTAGWRGVLPPERHPRVVNPDGGRIWTANQRLLGDPAYLALGDGGWDNGLRAGQIRDDLASVAAAVPADMLAVQLDDRARMLLPWREALVAALARLEAGAAGTTNAPAYARLAARAKAWDGAASATNTAFAPVARFRREAVALLLEPMLLALRNADGQEHGVPAQFDGVARRLLRERPANLLPPRFAGYDALLDEAARRVVAARELSGEPPWGRLNRLRMQHPFSGAMPWLSRWLDVPGHDQSGYVSGIPRIASPRFGASERMGVEPGREADGYLHMPGGQSAHFLSPFHHAGHDAWAEGRTTPILGGPPVHRLVLSSAR